MRTRDREPESPGPLKYAPKWARMAASEIGRGSEPRLVNSRPPDGRPPLPPRHREPAPLRKLALPKGSFEGDVAVKDLRERMARAPICRRNLRCAMTAGRHSASSDGSSSSAPWRRLRASGLRHRATGQWTAELRCLLTESRQPVRSRARSPPSTIPASMLQARTTAASGLRFSSFHAFSRLRT